jgi:hypothetical protein
MPLQTIGSTKLSAGSAASAAGTSVIRQVIRGVAQPQSTSAGLTSTIILPTSVNPAKAEVNLLSAFINIAAINSSASGAVAGYLQLASANTLSWFNNVNNSGGVAISYEVVEYV